MFGQRSRRLILYASLFAALSSFVIIWRVLHRRLVAVRTSSSPTEEQRTQFEDIKASFQDHLAEYSHLPTKNLAIHPGQPYSAGYIKGKLIIIEHDGYLRKDGSQAPFTLSECNLDPALNKAGIIATAPSDVETVVAIQKFVMSRPYVTSSGGSVTVTHEMWDVYVIDRSLSAIVGEATMMDSPPNVITTSKRAYQPKDEFVNFVKNLRRK